VCHGRSVGQASAVAARLHPLLKSKKEDLGTCHTSISFSRGIRLPARWKLEVMSRSVFLAKDDDAETCSTFFESK
jgi:hypothetical protein